MLLQLLIPQFDEDESIVKNMLDSLAIQQGVDFSFFEVLIGNDGSDTKLSKNFLGSYPFFVRYFEYEHSGHAGTRQKLFEESSANYIMYCDADDMFLDNLGLYAIFSYIYKGFDVLTCDYVEEIKSRKDGKIIYYTHHSDDRFVHGKVFRRNHLIENDIKWRSGFDNNEDSAYVILASAMAKDVVRCKLPLYLWKWRDTSVSRADPLFAMKTYPRFIRSNAQLVRDLVARNKWDMAKIQVGKLIYSTYFMLNNPSWLDPMNAKYRYNTEKVFKEYFEANKDLFNRIESGVRTQLISGVKHRVLGQGVLLEKFTFEDWIDHIEELE